MSQNYLWAWAQLPTLKGKTGLQEALNDLSVEELRKVVRAAVRLAHYANVEIDDKIRVEKAFEEL